MIGNGQWIAVVRRWLGLICLCKYAPKNCASMVPERFVTAFSGCFASVADLGSDIQSSEKVGVCSLSLAFSSHFSDNQSQPGLINVL